MSGVNFPIGVDPERGAEATLPPEYTGELPLGLLAEIEHPELQTLMWEIAQDFNDIETEQPAIVRPVLSILNFRDTNLSKEELNSKYDLPENLSPVSVCIAELMVRRYLIDDRGKVIFNPSHDSRSLPVDSVMSLLSLTLATPRLLNVPSAEADFKKIAHDMDDVLRFAEAERVTDGLTPGEFVATVEALPEHIVSTVTKLHEILSLEQLTEDQTKEFAELLDSLPRAAELDTLYAKGLFSLLRYFDSYEELPGVPGEILSQESNFTRTKRLMLHTCRLLDVARQISNGTPASPTELRDKIKPFLGGAGKDPNDVFGTDRITLISATVAMRHLIEIRNGLAPIFSRDKVLPGVAGVMVQRSDEHLDRMVDVRLKVYNTFQKMLDGLSRDGESIDDDLAGQFMRIEEYMLSRLEPLVNQYYDAVSEDSREMLDSYLFPRWQTVLAEYKEGQSLEAIDDFCAEKMQLIEEIDAPYTYTSRRIRALTNGPRTVREIDEELHTRGLHVGDANIAQTLGLLIAQSKAGDPIEYFAKLETDREGIERLLADIRYVGQERSSNLTAALNWIDEVIDAGEYDKIKHAGLKKFIESYFVGAEPEEEETSVADEEFAEEAYEQIEEPEVVFDVESEEVAAIEQEEPIVTEPEPIVAEEIPEPTVTVSPEAEEIAAQRETRRALLRSRFSTLKEYADELEGLFDEGLIELSDVTVFETSEGPKSIIERRNNRRRGDGFVATDMRRLYGLMQIKLNLEDRGMVAQVNVTQPTKKNRVPYLALSVRRSEDDETGVVVLEHPTHNHATYTADVDGGALQTWEDVSALSRQEILDFGGASTRHPDATSEFFMHHYDALEADILRRIRQQQ